MATKRGSGAQADASPNNRTGNCSNNYQAIFDGVSAAIMIHDVGNGSILEANRAAEELFGFSGVELTDMPLACIWPAASDPRVFTPLRESMTGPGEGKFAFTCRCHKKDGHEFWAEVSLQFWTLGENQRVLSVTRDITDHRERELRLRESEYRLRDIVESSRDIIYRRNIATGRIEFASGAVADVLGYTVEELVAKSRDEQLELIHEDSRSILAGHKNLVLSGRATGSELNGLRFRMRTKSGEWRWLEGSFGYPRDAAGDYKYVVGVLRDASRQVQAEEALRISEERYRHLVENASVGIVVAQDGYLKFANSKISEYTGYDRDELLAKPWPELIHADDRETSKARHQARYLNEPSSDTYRVRVVRKNGSFSWVDIGGVLIQWDGRPASLNFLIDVNEQVKAEQGLRSERDLVRRLLTTTPVGVLMIDRDLTVAFVNKRAEEVFGMSREEVVNHASFAHWDIRDLQGRPLTPSELPFDTVMKGLQPVYDFRHSLRLPDGRVLYLSSNITPFVDADGNFDGYLAAVEDITANWQAEEQVRMFKTIADHSPYGVILWSMDDHVVYTNEAAAAMHGYQLPEMIGLSVEQFVGPRDYQELMATKQVLLGAGSIPAKDLNHLHRDGHPVPTKTAASLVFDNTGNPKYIATTIVDMTETKRLQEFAARAERLETAGRIAGQVAHDFNNLLGPLVAYPELLRDEIGPSHAAMPYIDAMETAAQQMAEINQQLLTLGRRGHYTVEPVNLNRIVKQVLEQIRPRIAAVTVTLELQPDLMNTRAGAAQISRAVFNLINNAIDAMGEAGHLTVRTQNWYADRTNGQYNHIARGEYVKLTVADTGCGIEQEHLSRIFEPFFSTKTADASRGSGLGLSVVHAVVKDHHGYIDIDSRVGEGTSIYIYLPVTRETSEVEGADIPRGSGESILVIDDDPMQREVSSRLLGRLGYNVHTSESGEKALARLTTEQFDLILLDMIMPGGFDGVETLERILMLRPSQRAIIASGYAESVRIDRARDLGVAIFLRKPLTLASLGRAVREELDRVPVTPV